MVNVMPPEQSINGSSKTIMESMIVDEDDWADDEMAGLGDGI